MQEKTINDSAQKPETIQGYYVNRRCLKVGVLTNPRSGGNKKGLSGIRILLAGHPDVLHREETTSTGMHDALAEFAARGVELVVINGGDGTAHAALTIIGRGELFSKPPLFALLCAGTTSMLPRDVGIQGPAVTALSRIITWAESTDECLSVVPRPVLRVQHDTTQPPLFGMFFGAGAICQGIKVFHSGVNPMGWRGEIMPGLTLIRMLLAILRKDHHTVPPLQTKTSLDDQREEDRANLFVLVSTLERLFLGMRPYWGVEDGPLHYTALGSEPKRLLRVLPFLSRGQKNRHATPENGYSSHNAHKIMMRMEGDFTLDGELYNVEDGFVTIEPAGPMMFLRHSNTNAVINKCDHRTKTSGMKDVLSHLKTQTTQKLSPSLSALADAARACHGESVQAVLFYGSCLRTGNVHEGLADLYLLVDDYHSAFKSSSLAFSNHLLPPNVFYLEVPFEDQILRAKYAVLSLEDFRNGAGLWFHSYIWGRFAQRCGIVYAANDLVTQQIQESLANAVLTFVSRTLPQMDSPFTARDLWAKGLSLSYRAELRTEQAGAAARLFDNDPEYYQKLTGAAMNAAGYAFTEAAPYVYQAQTSVRTRRFNTFGWRVRSLQGKILSVLRLLKGFFTFKGGVDYIQWKIERHSGVRVEVGPGLRRFPPLACAVIVWRLYRQGAFR